MLRKFYNIKQIELHQKSEIPRSSISYYETGISKPTLSSLLKISSFFNMSIGCNKSKFTQE
ncbi:helix-turn-helix domain-containing protein [uncultured Clostridium sp.]|uniref:helix-turn-helix domain-containing protein n=1 Tax=uncultured Clostridium sp. TaxID=59620 RepID=UPI0037DDCD63